MNFLKTLKPFTRNMSSMSRISKAVIITETGSPAQAAKVYNVDLGPLPENKVAIRMLAAPVNPSDRNQVEGVYAKKKTIRKFNVIGENGEHQELEGFIGGNEGVGEVVELGSGITAAGGKGEHYEAMNGELKVGDWVVPGKTAGLGTWTNRMYTSPDALLVIRNREGLEAEQVGSIKVNASTSYRMLKDVVDLKPGDYVIQNGANSGAGQVLIQLARIWGFKTINIVRDRPDFAQLESYLKELGADIIIKESELNSEETKSLLGSLDAKPKLAINCVGGKAAMSMARYLEDGASFVTYGAMSRQPLSIPAGSFIFKDIIFRGYWVTKWYERHHHSEWLAMWDDILNLIKTGQLRHQKMNPLSWSSSSNAGAESFDLSDSELQTLVTNAMTSSTKDYFKY